MNAMRFEDLEFTKWRKEPSYWYPWARLILGKRAEVKFINGYTLSVILGNVDDDSFSNGVDTYEVGVFETQSGDPLENFGEGGVKGYVTKDDIEHILTTIESLPPVKKKDKVNFGDIEPITEETAKSLLDRLKELKDEFNV